MVCCRVDIVLAIVVGEGERINSPVVKVRRMLAMVCCRVDIVLAIVVGGGRENKLTSSKSKENVSYGML